MLLGKTPDVLVLSTYKSSNNPMLVNIQGKSGLESEVSSCGGPWGVDMSCMLFCPHVYHVIQFKLFLYFKIIQGCSTAIWISTMGMKCPFIKDVEFHCVVKCGILAVPILAVPIMYGRWVQNKF